MMPVPNQLPNNNRPFVFQRLRQLVCVELRAAIDTLAPGFTLAADKPLAKVWEYEQFPATPDEEKEAWKVPDPVTGPDDDPLKSYIEIEHILVREDPYTSELNTALTFDFNINFLMGVAVWNDPAFPYPTSAQLFEAVFAVCGERLRGNRTFGYDNVTHYYLQQPYAETLRDEEGSEPIEHVARWSLVITVAGARQ